MTTINEHPTHIGYSVDKEGLKSSGPMYLEHNADGNWVEYRRTPGEWDAETGVTIYDTGSWDYKLVDIRAVTKEDLIEYWTGDRDTALRYIRASKREVEKAKQRLQEVEESLQCSEEWLTWSEVRLQEVSVEMYPEGKQGGR